MTENNELQDQEFASFDVEDSQPAPQSYQEPTPQEDDDIPEKYRGKSPKEIAKMHQEAEKLIGRHSQEVSELRKLADDLIKQQSGAKVEPSPEIDFFDDPTTAVRKTIENTPEIQELRQLNHQLKIEKVHKYLTEKHGDYQALANSPDFVEWVKGNKNRVDTFLKAQNNFDLDAADDLITSYKIQHSTKSVSEGQQQVRDKQLKSAGVENSGSTSGAAKKVYRRADLIRLMKEDPRRYAKLQPEIMLAYQEKRIR